MAPSDSSRPLGADRALTTHDGTHSRHQLAHAVGLGDVVVGTHFQADNGVDLGTLGRHHDDRHLAALAQLTADVDATDLGQHHIQQNDVGLHDVESGKRLGPVDGHLDSEAFTGEPDDERLDVARLVLDNQHRLTFLCWPCSVSLSCWDAQGEDRAFALA